MNSLRFANAEYLNFIWVILVGLLGLLFYFRMRVRSLTKALGEKAEFLSGGNLRSQSGLSFWLMGLALLCLVLSLARPQAGQSKQTVKSEGIELVILFDVSTSMLAEDMKPSRLELAKKEALRLIDSGTGDRWGLIAFAGSAAVLSPITTDKEAIKMFIESLSTESVSNQGTDFLRALQEAEAAFQRGGTDPEESESKVTRALILISDGEDNEAGGIKAAEELQRKGMRIFSLGVGTEKGGPIPSRDEFGNLKGYKKDKSGNTILSQTKGTVLKELARIGGGSFYQILFGGQAIELVRQDLERLEKTAFDSKEITNYQELFQIPLAFAIALLILSLIFNRGRKAQRFWRGRFEFCWMMALPFLLGLQPETALAEAPEIWTSTSALSVFENNKVEAELQKMAAQAKSDAEKQEKPKAESSIAVRENYQRILGALNRDPRNPILRFNLAQVFESNREEDKALSEYRLAAEYAKEQNLKSAEFFSLVNAARMAAKQKNIPLALNLYQKALSLNSESVEVRTNIELLWQGQQGSGESSEDQKEGKESQDQDGKKPKEKDGKGQEPKVPKKEKPQPKPFQSKELTPQDVRKILDELKNQEQGIRAKEYDGKSEDSANEKDW